MTGQELRARREEAGVSRWDLSLRMPAYSPQMIQRIEEGLKAVPASYPADLGHVLSAIGAERKDAADSAAAKLLDYASNRDLTPATAAETERGVAVG